MVRQLLTAYDPDIIQNLENNIRTENPDASPAEINSQTANQHSQLIESAINVFHNPELRNYIVDVRKKYDQVIDTINIDDVTNIGWVKDQEAAAALTIGNFTAWIEAHKDEITALQIFYGQPYRRRELTYAMIKELYEKIKTEQPLLAPTQVWRAYTQMEDKATVKDHVSLPVPVKSGSLSKAGSKNELIALVSLIRKVSGIDANLTSYDKTVDKNFQTWVFKKQAGTTTKFTEEQMQWLRMVKDYVANSFHVEKEDFELDPFNKNGGLGRMWQLFGENTEGIIEELNEVLAA